MDAAVDFWRVILADLHLIPAGEEAFFRRLWTHGRLRYRGQPFPSGGFEELSARLLSASLRRRKSLFVQLPEAIQTVAPALFATSLLLDAVGKQAAGDRRHTRVTLFGSSVAIRAHLADVAVHGLSLAEVFRQVFLEGSARKAVTRSEGAELSDFFPQVVFSLSPASPREVLHRYRPTWIVIDCDSGGDIEWLPSVLAGAKQLEVPVIGWLSGYLSPAGEMVRRAKMPLFSWPPALNPRLGRITEGPITAVELVSRCVHPTIQPAIADGDRPQQLAALLAGARRGLVQLAGQPRSPFFDDCLRAGWRYLRALEALHVPLAFFEAECKQFWGLSTLASCRTTFERFVSSATTAPSEARQALAEIVRDLVATHDLLGAGDPPLWAALLGTSVADARQEQPCRIVFSGRSRRRLFELALLAIEGISVSDLTSVGVTLSSLSDAAADPDSTPATRSSSTETLREPAYLVGWPPRERQERIQSLLCQSSIRILILPHQETETKSRISALAAAVAVNSIDECHALREAGITSLPGNTGQTFRYVTVGNSERLSVAGITRQQNADRPAPLWQAPDSVREAQWLLSDDLGDEDERPAAVASLLDDHADTATTNETQIVESVLRVELQDGRAVLLDADTSINVMRGMGAYEELKERPAGTIRSGDRIVFIHGQRRQSLYDLLLGRVHGHPSIRLHLALVNMWHEEIHRAYHAWARRSGRGYEALLDELHALGCKRSAPLTVRFWVTGQILCPSDPEDIRRVAQVLEIPTVLEHYARVGRAADRLRGLHRGLAHRLNNWLRATAAGSAAIGEDDVFDEELGLRLSDFRESLEVLVVRSVERINGLFLRSSLNRFS